MRRLDFINFLTIKVYHFTIYLSTNIPIKYVNYTLIYNYYKIHLNI